MTDVRKKAYIAWITALMQARWGLGKEKTCTKGYEDEMGEDVSDLMPMVPGNI